MLVGSSGGDMTNQISAAVLKPCTVAPPHSCGVHSHSGLAKVRLACQQHAETDHVRDDARVNLQRLRAVSGAQQMGAQVKDATLYTKTDVAAGHGQHSRNDVLPGRAGPQSCVCQRQGLTSN